MLGASKKQKNGSRICSRKEERRGWREEGDEQACLELESGLPKLNLLWKTTGSGGQPYFGQEYSILTVWRVLER